MASLEDSVKITDALKAVREEQRAIEAKMEAAQAERKAAYAVYEKVAGPAVEVVRAGKVELEALQVRQSSIAALFHKPLSEQDSEHIESLLGSISVRASTHAPPAANLQVPPNVPPNGMEAPSKGTSVTEKPTPVTEPEKPSSTPNLTKAVQEDATLAEQPKIMGVFNTTGYQNARSHPILVTDGDLWCEIRCSQCQGNADPATGDFFKGVPGLQTHLAEAHGIVLSRNEIVLSCNYRDLTYKEVKRIVAGKPPLEKRIAGHVPPARRYSESSTVESAQNGARKRKTQEDEDGDYQPTMGKKKSRTARKSVT